MTPSTGNTVEVVAQKTAKAATSEAAKEALEKVEIREEVSSGAISISTKLPRGGGWFTGSTQVKYMVRVPAGAEVKFTTVNGGVEVTGLTGKITAETTNGGVIGRDIGGAIDASTTNGGVDVELARLAEGGAKLECTNGGIKLGLPSDSKATISASITNGGIDASGLTLETTQASRRRLEGKLNGGGAPDPHRGHERRNPHRRSLTVKSQPCKAEGRRQTCVKLSNSTFSLLRYRNVGRRPSSRPAPSMSLTTAE